MSSVPYGFCSQTSACCFTVTGFMVAQVWSFDGTRSTAELP